MVPHSETLWRCITDVVTPKCQHVNYIITIVHTPIPELQMYCNCSPIGRLIWQQALNDVGTVEVHEARQVRGCGACPLTSILHLLSEIVSDTILG